MHIRNKHTETEYHFKDKNGCQSNIHTLATTKSERDLGKIIRDDLKWSDRIQSAISKAKSALARIKKKRPQTGAQKRLNCYTQSFFRPHFE